MPPTLKVPPNAKYQPQNPKLVGHETGSMELDDIRARLFVGCLNLETCNRNDIVELFSMYGPIKGLTHFPKGGYAFVQFETAEDAEDAVLNLNRYMFQGIRLDVKIAQKDKLQQIGNAPKRGGFANAPRGRGGAAQARKRGPNEAGPSNSNWNKQARYGAADEEEEYNEDCADEGYDDNEFRPTGLVDPYAAEQPQHFGKAAQATKPKSTENNDNRVENEEDSEIGDNSNDANESKEGDATEETDPEKKTALEKRKAASEKARLKRVEQVKQRIYENVDDEEGSVLDQNEIPDILICGGCHLITSSAEFFYAHRMHQCDRKIVTKHEDEPKTFDCFHCTEKLHTSWELLGHLNRKHKMCFYKEAEPRTDEYPPLFAD